MAKRQKPDLQANAQPHFEPQLEPAKRAKKKRVPVPAVLLQGGVSHPPAAMVQTPAEEAQRAKNEDRAALIRQAAFHCFAEAGFYATTVDDICRHAGVSKGSFYWYYESKEQVFIQLLNVWANEVEVEVTRQFQSAFFAEDPRQALLQSLGREGRRGRRMLPVWLDALIVAQRHPDLRASMAEFLARVRRALTHVVTPTFKGFYGEAQIEAIAGLLLSSFIGSIAQEMAAPKDAIYDEHSRMLLVTIEHFGRLLQRDASAPHDAGAAPTPSR